MLNDLKQKSVENEVYNTAIIILQ